MAEIASLLPKRNQNCNYSKRGYCENATLNVPANLENSTVATRLEKVSFSPNSKKGNAKDFSNCRTIGLVLQTNKVVFKVLQASAVHDQELSA